MIKSTIQHLMVILLVAGVVGCAHFDPENNSSSDVDLPQTYSLYGESYPKSQPWWLQIDNPELNHLIETALSDSFTIQQAWARLRQARARSIQQNANRYPNLIGEAEAALGRRRVEVANSQTEGAFSQSGQSRTEKVENYGIGLISNYEIDLWGRVRAVGEAAHLDEAARQADLFAAAMTLSAEIAERWVKIISSRHQHIKLRDQLRTNRIRQELVELRYHNGLASSVEVFQQRELVARVEGRIPLVETQTALLTNQLALLLGNPDKPLTVIKTNALPPIDPVPDPGLPIDLLANRPDVMASGARLHAARWQWSAARAARLPAIRLTATARYSANQLDLVFSNWLINLAANLTAPIFDAGHRKAEVDRTQAAVDEQLAIYRHTVFSAFLEVENAMIQERNLHRNLVALEQEIDNARKALNEATNRYRKGLGDYLPVLTQLVNAQNLELSLIQRREEIVLTRIGLHRALGGVWFESTMKAPSTLNKPAARQLSE